MDLQEWEARALKAEKKCSALRRLLTSIAGQTQMMEDQKVEHMKKVVVTG